MSETPSLNTDSPAVQKHLDFLQGVIDRMAAESRALKTWCITIVAAILFVVARTDAHGYTTLIALFPVAAFGVLDAYYLGLERGFRVEYNEFIGKLHSKQLSVNDLYVVKPRDVTRHWWAAFTSIPVMVFYLTVVASILVATCLLTEYAHMGAPMQACQTECVSPPER